MTDQADLFLEAACTREQFPTRQAWLDGRRQSLGASDAAAVLGLHPWKSPLSLYAEKVTPPTADDAAQAEAAAWGLRLEPLIAEEYARVTGRALTEPEPWTFYRSKAYPFLTASFDRRILGDPRGVGVLQLKTAGAYAAETWEEEPPLAYQIQTQQEMLVAGATWGALAVLIGGQRFRYFDLTRSERFLAVLVERAERFWTGVLGRTPPAADGSVATREALRRLYPEATPGAIVELPAEAEAWDAARLDAIARLKAAEAEKDAAENALRAALGPAETGLLPNGVTYTYKSTERKGYTVAPTTVRTLRRTAAPDA